MVFDVGWNSQAGVGLMSNQTAGLPRITFGLIVLNGKPFTRYNLRALYPFAYEIIVVEGASSHAAHTATPDGHSVDGTLEILRRFKAEEDPDNKITIVTAEDEGHPNGFWPGEKDEQSQAYAKRATGDWLWQVDIDEFYHPEDMQRVCEYLQTHPEVTCLIFNAYHFWGSFDYLVQGGLFMSHRFQGEPWGAYRRVFKWGPGYRYVTHRPPTVWDAAQRDCATINKHNLSRQSRPAPIYMYHYTNLFPKQVIPKGAYYANQGWAVGIAQRRKFESFLAPLDEQKATRIYDHFGTYNWLRRFHGQHPPQIKALRSDLECGFIELEVRPNEDIEKVLSNPGYLLVTRFLYFSEWLRNLFLHLRYAAWMLCKRAIVKSAPYWQPVIPMWLVPEKWRLRLGRLMEQ